MDLFRLAAGVALLFFGRQLFWLFVGSLGFLTGAEWGRFYFWPDNDLAVLVFALFFGMIGIILAVFLQGIAVLAAGFLGGAYIAGILTARFVSVSEAPGLIVLAGGLIGGFLSLLFFQSALILFSSLVGAVFVAESLPGDFSFKIILLVVMFIIGATVQYLLLK